MIIPAPAGYWMLYANRYGEEIGRRLIISWNIQPNGKSHPEIIDSPFDTYDCAILCPSGVVLDDAGDFHWSVLEWLGDVKICGAQSMADDAKVRR